MEISESDTVEIKKQSYDWDVNLVLIMAINEVLGKHNILEIDAVKFAGFDLSVRVSKLPVLTVIR